ncbi:MAG: hypothetical protein R3C56_36080 [Pirellulaceae bacterium]
MSCMNRVRKSNPISGICPGLKGDAMVTGGLATAADWTIRVELDTAQE